MQFIQLQTSANNNVSFGLTKRDAKKGMKPSSSRMARESQRALAQLQGAISAQLGLVGREALVAALHRGNYCPVRTMGLQQSDAAAFQREIQGIKALLLRKKSTPATEKPPKRRQVSALRIFAQQIAEAIPSFPRPAATKAAVGVLHGLGIRAATDLKNLSRKADRTAFLALTREELLKEQASRKQIKTPRQPDVIAGLDEAFERFGIPPHDRATFWKRPSVMTRVMQFLEPYTDGVEDLVLRRQNVGQLVGSLFEHFNQSDPPNKFSDTRIAQFKKFHDICQRFGIPIAERFDLEQARVIEIQGKVANQCHREKIISTEGRKAVFLKAYQEEPHVEKHTRGPSGSIVPRGKHVRRKQKSGAPKEVRPEPVSADVRYLKLANAFKGLFASNKRPIPIRAEEFAENNPYVDMTCAQVMQELDGLVAAGQLIKVIGTSTSSPRQDRKRPGKRKVFYVDGTRYQVQRSLNLPAKDREKIITMYLDPKRNIVIQPDLSSGRHEVVSGGHMTLTGPHLDVFGFSGQLDLRILFDWFRQPIKPGMTIEGLPR